MPLGMLMPDSLRQMPVLSPTNSVTVPKAEDVTGKHGNVSWTKIYPKLFQFLNIYNFQKIITDNMTLI